MKQVGLGSIPEDSIVANLWEDSINRLHALYDIKNNLAPQIRSQMGTNLFSRFVKSNPTISGIAEAGLNVTGAGTAIKGFGLLAK